MRVCNTFHISKMLVNVAIDEINEFMNKFRLQLRVVDDTSNAAILVWNHEAVDLLGKTVAELKAELHEQGNEKGIPIDFEKLEEREMLFMVQVRHENVRKKSDVFSLTKLSVDPNIISKYAGMQLVSHQESYLYSTIEKTVTEEGKFTYKLEKRVTNIYQKNNEKGDILRVVRVQKKDMGYVYAMKIMDKSSSLGKIKLLMKKWSTLY
ncbi:Eukaryotic translation initiation factor 2 subunit alpha [Forsythia ovata]|uniref:Eukaryotic translation initiation factor 2 subunit alpha n=1 Tax=Forsythia ovata TaxID=205694 RepID=A0ABD1NUW7_9LAMI